MAKLSVKTFAQEKQQTEKLSPGERKKRLAEIYEYHEPIFSMLGVSESSFYPKVKFKWNDEFHISLYERELTKNPFYIEVINDDYSPEDPNRTLYMFRGNQHSINEYFEKKNTNEFGEYSRYFVPLSDFEKVDIQSSITPQVKQTLFTGPKLSPMVLDIEDEVSDEEEDALMSKLTIRDHAAIQWKLPVSNKKWLNNLIKKINKM